MSRLIHAVRATVTAPCKVNLTLDVFPPGTDGFHPLDSVVATFSLADEIVVDVTPSETFSLALNCDDPSLPADGGNLAYRAAAAFYEHLRQQAGADEISLHLAKRIPHQAGLGGGSSDAAAVLRALAMAYAVPGFDPGEIAAALGSDVPLFLAETPAVRMRGRGERLSPLPRPLPALYGIIVRPDTGVPTGPAYRLLDTLPARTPGAASERLISALAESDGTLDPETLATLLSNDFEAAVLPAFPDVAAAHEAVRDAGAIRALLSGSGSAIFGLARDAAQAQALAESLQGRFPFVAAVASLTNVPEISITKGHNP